jgi:hypothetical protein
VFAQLFARWTRPPPHPRRSNPVPENFFAPQSSLERGLVPDDGTLRQLSQERDSTLAGESLAALRWPDEPLRSVLLRRLSTLGVARFAAKYPALKDALLRGLLDLVVKYYKTGAQGGEPQTFRHFM